MTMLRPYRVLLHIGCLLLIAAIVAIAGAGGASGRQSADRLSADCGRIAFAPNSDDLAFGIKGSGTTCRTARAVAGASAPDRLRPGPDRSYRAERFLCRGKFVQPLGKYYEHYTCRSAHATVIFDRG